MERAEYWRLMSLLGIKHGERVGIIAIGLLGAALLYGDGAITPAISVLSALEGLKIPAPDNYALHRAAFGASSWSACSPCSLRAADASENCSGRSWRPGSSRSDCLGSAESRLIRGC